MDQKDIDEFLKPDETRQQEAKEPDTIETLNAKIEELERIIQQQQVIHYQQQPDLLSKLIDKGVEVFDKYQINETSHERFTLEKKVEFDKEELSVINRLDLRDKYYKTGILFLCLLALVGAIYFGKFEGLAGMIGLIIGFIFKNDIISVYYTATRKKSSASKEE